MKSKRQEKIIELVSKYNIDTQDELTSRLSEEGFKVTQATVSRDIREMRLKKMVMPEGGQKYVVPDSEEKLASDKYTRVLQDGFVSRAFASHMIVVKTVSGMAMAVAAAIDNMDIPGIVGCIAGDDTIMCAIHSEEEAYKVMELIDKVIKE